MTSSISPETMSAWLGPTVWMFPMAAPSLSGHSVTHSPSLTLSVTACHKSITPSLCPLTPTSLSRLRSRSCSIQGSIIGRGKASRLEILNMHIFHQSAFGTLLNLYSLAVFFCLNLHAATSAALAKKTRVTLACDLAPVRPNLHLLSHHQMCCGRSPHTVTSQQPPTCYPHTWTSPDVLGWVKPLDGSLLPSRVSTVPVPASTGGLRHVCTLDWSLGPGEKTT